MEFDRPLTLATLIKRYKRFLADVELSDGRVVTAHCANPGAMTGLNAPGMRVWLEPNEDPKRKLKFSWKLAEVEGGLVGIDTSLPNKVIGEALGARQVPELAHYTNVRAEMKYGANSRIDFLLTEPGYPDAYVEVKNAHLRRADIGDGTWAEFPDSITKRGAKHLGEMAEMVRAGHRAVTLFLVQRDDCRGFRLAADIDPTYAAATELAREAGVETLAYRANLTRSGVTLGSRLPLGGAEFGGASAQELE